METKANFEKVLQIISETGVWIDMKNDTTHGKRSRIYLCVDGEWNFRVYWMLGKTFGEQTEECKTFITGLFIPKEK